MIVRIFTAFPEYFENTLNVSLLKSTKEDGIWSLEIINLRDYSYGKHKKIDGTTYGGGGGLILRPDVLSSALEDKIQNLSDFKLENPNKSRILILTSPRGELLNQKLAQNYSSLSEINIISNRFEGVDQRVIDFYNIKEISIGNYVLLGGEVAVCVILESILRLIPNFLKNQDTIKSESFSDQLNGNYEYPHYTKPEIWNEIKVPNVLKSGNHAEIEKWRRQR